MPSDRSLISRSAAAAAGAHSNAAQSALATLKRRQAAPVSVAHSVPRRPMAGFPSFRFTLVFPCRSAGDGYGRRESFA